VTTAIKLPDIACGVVRELPVLLLDAHLLAVNKPAGIPVTFQSEQPEPSALLPLLHKAIAEGRAWAKSMELDYLMPVHRPEPQTSGVLLFARSAEALASLTDQFASVKVHQEFSALVKGSPAEDEFELDVKLSPHPDRPGQLRADSRQGKRYRTQCKVLQRFHRYTLLRCHPFPGRSGQVIAHLRHARIPVVADPDRGGAGIFLSQLKRDYEPKKNQPERPLIGRPALHLDSITFAHPATGTEQSVHAPLAKDFNVALKYLRRFAVR